MVKRYYSYVGIYIFTFLAIGMLLPLLGQYMDSIGFNGVQIGIVTATGTLIGIGASPFWGYRSHHSKDSMRVVLLLCFITALIITGMMFIKEYFIFLIMYAAFAFFQIPIMPLVDAMSLEAEVPFGAVRKWGALGFAAGVFIAGQLADMTSLIIIFPLCAFGYTVTWIIMVRLRAARKKDRLKVKSYSISDSETREPSTIESDAEKVTLTKHTSLDLEQQKKTKHGNYGILFHNKKLMALLFAAFFICGTNVANNTYFGFLYKDVGGSIAGIGVAFLLMCSSEAPFMAWADRLSGKFTMEKLILFSMLISAFRYLWYSTGPAPELLIGTFFIQGMVNGIVLVELIRYITKLVEPAMIGMAMTLYQAVSSNCSSILCQLISGAILDHYNGIKVYFFFAIYNMIGVIFYIVFGLYKCSEENAR